MLRRVALVRNSVSVERSSDTSVLTRATRRNIPEHVIFYNYLRENLKSYINISILEKVAVKLSRPGLCNYFRGKLLWMAPLCSFETSVDGPALFIPVEGKSNETISVTGHGDAYS
jgi:hypothetical protein